MRAWSKSSSGTYGHGQDPGLVEQLGPRGVEHRPVAEHGPQPGRVVGEPDPVLGGLVEREVELARRGPGQRAGADREGHGSHLSPAGVTTSSCVHARVGLVCEVLDGPGDLGLIGRLVAVRARRSSPAVLGESIVASTISSATWMPCSRSSERGRVRERPRRRGAGRPQAAAGDRPPGQPPVTWISVFAPARTPSLRKTNACSATAAGPAAEAVDRRLGERAAAERAGRRRPGGGDRVDDQVERAELGRAPARAPRAARPGRTRRPAAPARRRRARRRASRRARDGGAAASRRARWWSRIAPPRLRAPRTTSARHPASCQARTSRRTAAARRRSRRPPAARRPRRAP